MEDSPTNQLSNNYNSEIRKNLNEMNSTDKIKLNKKFKFNLKKNIIKRNNLHNDFGHQLTYNKKVSNELDTLPKEINQFFRKSLNKYNFHMEVYVPKSMRISKKEYYNKNYMLNNIVNTNFKIENEKNKIMKIKKETGKFSKQYQIVKDNNKNKQKEYLLDLENEYKKKDIKEIEYKKDENIFTPSFLLDVNYGNNINVDMYKYGQNNDLYLTEAKKDNIILNKFYNVINNRNKNEKEENQDTNQHSTKEDEIINQIKNELTEKMRIQNMTSKEYFNYSKKLKNEINIIKNMIKNDNIDKNSDSKDNSNNNNLNETKDNKLNNLKEEIISNSLHKENHSKEKNSKEEKIKSGITDKGKINKKTLNLLNKIPKLAINKIKSKNYENGVKETKSFRLNQLYNTLSTRNTSDLPYKQLNKYFSKYSPIKFPSINTKRGSNIHGLTETLQNIVHNKNIAVFSKLNGYLKRDLLMNENNNKNTETENIIKTDNKILGLNYEFVESLLSNKKDKLSSNNNI